MSFKRDGDDISLLNRLKHHRVSELLGSCIPEDEAKLLSNGRLTCLVCTHRPIFDTISMLSKHRQGKKHIFELNKYIRRNEQLELLKMKKEQQNYVDNCKNVELTMFKKNSLLLGPKVNSTSSSNIAVNRRKVIDIPEINYCAATTSCEGRKQACTSSSSQLRKYLKRIKKKQPLERIVEVAKSNYSSDDCKKIETDIVSCTKLNVNVDSNGVKNSNCSKLKDFSRNLSGWIQDKQGNWIKDPEAEFDSDEDD